MLCGIGGDTIQKCKDNLSYEEYLSWRLYRNLRGPLSLHQRVDRIGALMAVRMSGGKMKDYMPWSGENKDVVKEEDGLLLTPENLVALVRSDERRALRLAKKTQKMLQSNNNAQTKQERIERLRKLKNRA